MEVSLAIQMQILYIAISFVILMILIAITKRITRKVTLVKQLEPNRKKVVLNAFYFLYLLIFGAAVIIISGIKLEDVTIFFSSVIISVMRFICF